MEFVLKSWSNAVIYSANSISACEGCRADRNSRPGYSIGCMCNITARAVDMVQITAGQDVTTSRRAEIQTRLLRMKLCVMQTSLSGVTDALNLTCVAQEVRNSFGLCAQHCPQRTILQQQPLCTQGTKESHRGSQISKYGSFFPVFGRLHLSHRAESAAHCSRGKFTSICTFKSIRLTKDL